MKLFKASVLTAFMFLTVGVYAAESSAGSIQVNAANAADYTAPINVVVSYDSATPDVAGSVAIRVGTTRFQGTVEHAAFQTGVNGRSVILDVVGKIGDTVVRGKVAFRHREVMIPNSEVRFSLSDDNGIGLVSGTGPDSDFIPFRSGIMDLKVTKSL